MGIQAAGAECCSGEDKMWAAGPHLLLLSYLSFNESKFGRL